MTLDVVDLDEHEQSVYEWFVASGRASIAELARTLGVTEARIRPTVDQLAEKGLLNRIAGQPDLFLAAPPDVALEGLLLAKEEQIMRARLLVQRLAGLHDRNRMIGDPGQFVETVLGAEVVRMRVAQIQRACRHEIRTIGNAACFSTARVYIADVERELVDRGVRWRAIYDAAGLERFNRPHLAGQGTAPDWEVARVLPTAPTTFMLVDDRLGVLPVCGPSAAPDSAVVVYQSPVLDGLSALFEALWERSHPLCFPSGELINSELGPSADDRRLLGLLTAGLTDETISKQLGVSHRTMQRRLRSLLDRLGAQTRFQAALRAAALGWVPTEDAADQAGSPPEAPSTLSSMSA